ncbi:unnamed protein product [Larinioides sclopetarius]|uniref:Uncharacterized protein n=1 Tax=Larinioides sclopetarius TaxID=280406 RepID=A0AAV2BWF7_9ARAC
MKSSKMMMIFGNIFSKIRSHFSYVIENEVYNFLLPEELEVIHEWLLSTNICSAAIDMK